MSRFTLYATRLIAFAACIFFAMPVSAALLFSEPTQIAVTPNQEFEVAFYLDTQEDDLNAMEGVLAYPTDLLELKEIRDGSSIINFWVDRPTLDQSPVTFSGIIPGGYRFPKGLVLSFVFKAKKDGAGVVHIEKARALRNDGLGTEAPLTLAFSSVMVSAAPKVPAPAVTPMLDTEAPESFRPELARDPSIFDGKWFLSFATQDKATGIDRYEVQESYAWGNGSWIKASSPYVLVGQNPSFPIKIKAIDRAGNERIESVPVVPHVRTSYENAVLIGIIILVALILLAKQRSVWKRKK
ncbi:hypothetical protein IT087_02095 [Candidatus Uhrbacteria bacterium]|nr:hypothetical protein [Candidatus Uhrbacteria bacterium]